MNNPIHPKGLIELNGAQFTLRFEHRDFAKAEGRLGMALIGPPSRTFWESGLSAHMTGVLLYVGLLNCEKVLARILYPPTQEQVKMRSYVTPTLDLDDILGLINYDNATYVEQTVMDVALSQMPQPKPDAPTEPEEKQADPLAPPSGGTGSAPLAKSISDSPSESSGA